MARSIPAVPVPRRAAGSIDAGAQRDYSVWMAGQPVAGVAVWAHTGRGLHLDVESREQVLAAWRHALPRSLVVVAGCGVPIHTAALPHDPGARTDAAIRETVAMAEHARRGGADALLVHPPGALASLSQPGERVVALHEALAGTGTPVIAFVLYREASGLEYDDDTLDALLTLPHVVGVKVATLNSVMRVQDIMSRMLERHPDRLLHHRRGPVSGLFADDRSPRGTRWDGRGAERHAGFAGSRGRRQ